MKMEKVTLASLTVGGKGEYGIGASAVDRSDDLYTYLRITDIKDDGTLNTADLKSVSDEKASRYLLKPNDIVFARTGASTGRNYFYDGSDGDLVYAGFLIKFSLDPQKVNPKYIKYYCLSDAYRGWVHSFNTGSTRGNINAQTLGNMEVPLPTRSQQDGIVSILSSFDAKIRNNNALNDNLEQQAQAVYQNFIASYKTSLISVDDIVLSANTGADAIKKAPIVDYDTGIRCVRVGDMSNLRPTNEWGFANVSPDVFKQYQLHKDDIIVTRTASLGLNQLIHEDLNAVYNNGLIRITVNTDIVSPMLVYRQFQTEDFKNYINRINGETSVRPNMKINYLLKYKFNILSKTDQYNLMQIITPLFCCKQKNIQEIQLLASLRDTLLPQLMSGELDISNVNF